MSCLFRLSSTILLTFERSENVARLSGPLSWPTDLFVSAHASTL